VPAIAIRDQLAGIENRPGLISSARVCRFLTRLVNRTTHGDIDRFTELSIAMEVFDGTSEDDPNIDAIVRVEARGFRSKLNGLPMPGRSNQPQDQVYESLSGRAVFTPLLAARRFTKVLKKLNLSPRPGP
jgi:hypothetical protein